MERATWHITDTFTEDVEVLKRTETEAQIRANASGVVGWVRLSELTDIKET